MTQMCLTTRSCEHRPLLHHIRGRKNVPEDSSRWVQDHTFIFVIVVGVTPIIRIKQDSMQPAHLIDRSTGDHSLLCKK